MIFDKYLHDLYHQWRRGPDKPDWPFLSCCSSWKSAVLLALKVRLFGSGHPLSRNITVSIPAVRAARDMYALTQAQLYTERE